jgi:hypothetical protein
VLGAVGAVRSSSRCRHRRSATVLALSSADWVRLRSRPVAFDVHAAGGPVLFGDGDSGPAVAFGPVLVADPSGLGDFVVHRRGISSGAVVAGVAFVVVRRRAAPALGCGQPQRVPKVMAGLLP